MHIDVNDHVMYKIANEPILTYPYPHFFIQSIFPESFYENILSNLPPTSKYTSIAETGRVTQGSYKERFIIFVTARQYLTICLSYELQVYLFV